MERNYLLLLVLIVVVLTSCAKKDNNLNVTDADLPNDFAAVQSGPVEGQYIVVLYRDASIAALDVKGKSDHINAKAIGLLKKYGVSGSIEKVYETALQGFVLKADSAQVAKMMTDPTVKSVEVDQYVSIMGKRTTKPSTGSTTASSTNPSQSIPWGVTRVGGGASYNGAGVAWVLDTGIDLTHPDLKVDASRGISFVAGVASPNDDNGHGTHIAGTIAAINNGYGVVGVAAGATVIPVKVLSSTGCGSFADVLSGINYVAANGKAGDVVNLSIDGGASTTIDNAIATASAVVKFAIAAGNQGDNANNYSPARAEGVNIYTVSAMSLGDAWASLSNFANGPVDYCAPGVSVYSTCKGGSYATMSGTSMAAPHLAGLLLLGNITTNGYVNNDPDGTPDRIAHR